MTLIQTSPKKIYIRVDSPYPATWLLYLPLSNNIADASINGVVVSSTNTPTFETVWWVSAIKWYNTTTWLTASLSFTSNTYTQSVRYYAIWNSDRKCMWANNNWSDVDISFVTNSGNSNRLSNYYTSDTFTSTSYATDAWHMFTVTRDWNTQKIYHDSTLISTATKTNQSYSYNKITLLQRTWWWQQRPWYLSDFVVDSAVWSDSDVTTYYNSKKSKYWY